MASIESDAFLQAIKDNLEKSAAELESKNEQDRLKLHTPLSTRVRVVQNSDSSIDGELSIVVPPDITVEKLITAMDEHTNPLHGTWVTTGMRYQVRPDEPMYENWMGMSQAETYAQRNSRTKLAMNLGVLRIINKRMKAKGRLSAQEIFVRLNWNPKNKNPRRVDLTIYGASRRKKERE